MQHYMHITIQNQLVTETLTVTRYLFLVSEYYDIRLLYDTMYATLCIKSSQCYDLNSMYEHYALVRISTLSICTCECTLQYTNDTW